MTPLTSIIMPVYNEGENVVPYLERLLEAAPPTSEILVVYDFPEDTTVPVLQRYDDPRLKPILNTVGRGPAGAIRAGFEAAAGDVLVVTMADGSDDASQIEVLSRLVRSGNAVAAASRYMPGGKQIGGPIAKRALSRAAGTSLFLLARVGTRDATNSFKAYSSRFVEEVGVESTGGFEIAIELVAKARRRREAVAEIPTTWRDRSGGESRFRITAWAPKYLKWYVYAFGPVVSRGQTPVRTECTS